MWNLLHSFAIFSLCTILPAPQTAPQPSYSIVNLGERYSVQYSGVSQNGLSGNFGFLPNITAFSVHDGKFIDLGALSGCRESQAWDINAYGQIAGACASTSTLGSYYHAVLWQDNTMLDLGTLGGLESFSYAVNDQGMVVGTSRVSTDFSHAFLWRHGNMEDLGVLSGDLYSFAGAVNRNAEVIGLSQDINGHYRSFLWKNGLMQELAGFGLDTYAQDINDCGEVVGGAEIIDGFMHATVWKQGALLDIHPADYTSSVASAVNNQGILVGSAHQGNPFELGRDYAFLWKNGIGENLNALIPSGSGWQLKTAHKISEDGKILGFGLFQGKPATFLLIP